MGFLDTQKNNNTTTIDRQRLGEGVHFVTLTTLKWNLTKDLGICEFTDKAGATYTEWLDAASDGHKVRVRVLLQRLCTLIGVPFRSPADLADFDLLGAELVARATPLRLSLEEYQYTNKAGETKTKTALAGRFEECLGAAVTDATDLDAF